MARYCLFVLSEASGVPLPVSHPAVVRCAKFKSGVTRRAPVIPTEAVLKLETEARNRDNPAGWGCIAVYFFLLTMASLRFGDTADVSHLWLTDSALFGMSINHKRRTGATTNWAMLRKGMNSNGARLRPLLRFWDRAEPIQEGGFTWLSPFVSTDWEVGPKRKATYGVAQDAFRRLGGQFSFPKGITLHSPRNWCAACAGELLHTRDHRGKLGRWAPGL